MKQRIERLKNLASTTGNSYLHNELNLLEAEIRIEIMKAKIEVYRSLNKINKVV